MDKVKLTRSFQNRRIAARWFNKLKSSHEGQIFRGNVILDCLYGNIHESLFYSFLDSLADYFRSNTLSHPPNKVLSTLRSKNEAFCLPGSPISGFLPKGSKMCCRGSMMKQSWYYDKASKALCKSIELKPFYYRNILGTSGRRPVTLTRIRTEVIEWMKKTRRRPKGLVCGYGGISWAVNQEELEKSCKDTQGHWNGDQILDLLGLPNFEGMVLLEYPKNFRPCRVKKPTFFEGTGPCFRVTRPNPSSFGKTLSLSKTEEALSEAVHSCHPLNDNWLFRYSLFENAKSQAPDLNKLLEGIKNKLRIFKAENLLLIDL